MFLKKKFMVHQVAPTVTLFNWKLQRVPNDSELTKYPHIDYPLWIILEGYRKNADGSVQLWHSSLIVRRIEPRLFMTASGKVYSIEGPMDEDGMRDSLWPEEIISSFKHGFPPSWLHIIHPCLQIDRKRTPRAVASAVANNDLDEACEEGQRARDLPFTSVSSLPPIPSADAKPPKDSTSDDVFEALDDQRSPSPCENAFKLSQPTRRFSLKTYATNGKSAILAKEKKPSSKPGRKAVIKSHDGNDVKRRSSMHSSALVMVKEETDKFCGGRRSRSGRSVVPPVAFWENQYKVTAKDGRCSIVNYRQKECVE